MHYHEEIAEAEAEIQAADAALNDSYFGTTSALIRMLWIIDIAALAWLFGIVGAVTIFGVQSVGTLISALLFTVAATAVIVRQIRRTSPLYTEFRGLMQRYFAAVTRWNELAEKTAPRTRGIPD